MQDAAPKLAGETFESRLDNMLAIKGEKVLPQSWPPVAGGRRFAAFPMCVTFRDVADPSSIELVDPDDLTATLRHHAQTCYCADYQ